MTMTLAQFSVDGGQTWVDLTDTVRIRYNEVREDDDELQDLHLLVTSEGLILNRVGQVSGEIVGTASFDSETLTNYTEA